MNDITEKRFKDPIKMAMATEMGGKSLLAYLQENPDKLTESDCRLKTGELSAAIERNKARLTHAIKCLKKKGLYSDTYEGLSQICEDKHLSEAYCQIKLLDSCVEGIEAISPNKTNEILEKSWRAGIELTVMSHDPERMRSEDLFGTLLMPNIGDIYVNTLMINYIWQTNDRIDEYNKAVIEIKAHIKESDNIKTINDLYDETARLQEQINDLIAANAILLQQQQEWQKEKEAFSKTVQKIQNNTLPIESQLQNANEKLLSKDSEIASLTAELNKLKNECDQKDRIISQLSQAALSNKKLPDLPETDIVFVGGHTNMVKKIMQIHPKWRFIDGNIESFGRFSKATAIFIWDKHLSHKVKYKLNNIITSDMPVIYLKQTNIDMLEEEMKAGYATTLEQTKDCN